MIRSHWLSLHLFGATLLLMSACGDDGGAPQDTGDSSSSGPGITTAPPPVTTAEDITTSGDTTTLDTTGTSTTAGPSTGPTTGGDEATTGPGSWELACAGKVYQCGDGLDNDGDGAIDNADLECISPCDDDERSFQTALPGQAKDCKNDCYWDADSGAGQDKCEKSLECDSQDPGGQIGCGFVDECPAETPAQCLDFCVPLIPNGCDCFGCCHIDTPEGVQDLYLDSSPECALGNLAACNRCTFEVQCANPCEGCEVCFGEQAPPAGCDPGQGEQCEAGVVECTMGGDECPADHFCQTGCCRPIAVP